MSSPPEEPVESTAKAAVRDITARSVISALLLFSVAGVVLLAMWMNGTLVLASEYKGDGRVKCPFCKKETAEAVEQTSIRSGRSLGHRVVCKNNDCRAEGPIRSSKKNATTAWNRAFK